MINLILSNIKAAIFDMDGTLIDSMNIWKEIDEEFLGQRNLIPPVTFSKDIEGMSFHETALHFKNTFNLTEELYEIKEIWHNMAIDKYSNQIQLKSGAYDFLKFLMSKDIKLAIATSNSKDLAIACLKSLNIYDDFDSIITGDDINNGKPSPEIYLKTAHRLSVPAENSLVFEDIPNGIQAGINAGMNTCAVYDDFSKDLTDIKKELADYYIESFDEVMKLISY